MRIIHWIWITTIPHTCHQQWLWEKFCHVEKNSYYSKIAYFSQKFNGCMENFSLICWVLLTLYLCVISGQKHPSDISVFDLMGIDTFMCNFRTKTPLFSPTPLAQYLSLHSGLPLFVILLQQSTPQHLISIHKLHILMMFSIFSMFNVFNLHYFQYFHKSIL